LHTLGEEKRGISREARPSIFASALAGQNGVHATSSKGLKISLAEISNQMAVRETNEWFLLTRATIDPTIRKGCSKKPSDRQNVLEYAGLLQRQCKTSSAVQNSWPNDRPQVSMRP
jgi:hypothetical protein